MSSRRSYSAISRESASESARSAIYSPGTIGVRSLVEQAEALISSRKRVSSVSFSQASSFRRRRSVISTVVDKKEQERKATKPHLDTAIFKSVPKKSTFSPPASPTISTIENKAGLSPVTDMSEYYNKRVGILLTRWINRQPIPWHVRHVMDLTVAELRQLFMILQDLVSPDFRGQGASGNVRIGAKDSCLN